jgi:hypothetical protein
MSRFVSTTTPREWRAMIWPRIERLVVRTEGYQARSNDFEQTQSLGSRTSYIYSIDAVAFVHCTTPGS